MAKQNVLTRSKKKKAEALLQQRRFQEARELYGRICQLDPQDYDAWLTFGALSGQLKQYQDAQQALEKAVQLRPDVFEGHFNLARLYELQHRLAEAATHYRHCLRLRPQALNVHLALAPLMAQLGRLPEAEQVCRDGLRFEPNNPSLHNNLGIILREQKRYDEALACFQRCLSLVPPNAGVYNNVGNVHLAMRHYDQALAAYEQALALDPNSPHTLESLGYFHKRQGKFTEALAYFDRVLALTPNAAGVRWNRCHVLLLLGRFNAGWGDYEARFDTVETIRQFGRRSFSKPRWNGEAIGDGTLLVHAEQGAGDSLQFCRYLPLLAGRAGRVLFECRHDLAPLMADLPGVEVIEARPGGAEPFVAFDCHIPLLSLPGVFGTELETIPAAVPYLHADAARVASKAELIAGDGVKVGLAWAGSPTNIADERRSLTLSALGPLLAVDGVRFYSLQKGPAARQVHDLAKGMTVVDLDADIDDFADTAAIMAHLDLVISVDTSVAHLAGALGVKVWTLIYHPPDWRWLLDRDDSPWYPTMRLFRQHRVDEWGPVIDDVASALRAFSAG